MSAVPTCPPLDGLTVLDFSQYVAGPFATMLLSDLGADVVKVERPGGDAYRHYDAVTPGMSRYFCSLNRGKRSIECDLTEPGGRASARALLARADAVVHNFLPERAETFGLDAASVAAVNPDAVLCVVSAFGTTGPEAGVPGYDLIAQAVSGLLALAARPGQDVPERLGGIPLADFTTGLLAAIAVLSGLVGRERHRGGAGGPEAADEAGAPGREHGQAPGPSAGAGQGAHEAADPTGAGSDFEVSLLGAALALQAQQLPMSGDGPPPRLDRRRWNESAAARAAAAELEPYYRCYEVADGYIAIACLDVAQRRRLMAALGLADPWVDNPQRPPADGQERSARSRLVRQVEARLRQEPIASVLSRLEGAGVPSAEVLSPAAAASSEQARANGIVLTREQPGLGPTRFLGGVLKRGGEPLVAPGVAPRPGEHSLEIETALGEALPS